MNGEESRDEAQNQTPKPHCVDPHSVTITPKEGRRRVLSEKFVRLSEKWSDDR
jgi:hypothetical protein